PFVYMVIIESIYNSFILFIFCQEFLYNRIIPAINFQGRRNNSCVILVDRTPSYTYLASKILLEVLTVNTKLVFHISWLVLVEHPHLIDIHIIKNFPFVKPMLLCVL